MSLFKKKKKVPSAYDIAVTNFRKAIWEHKLAEQRFHYAEDNFIDCAIMELDIAERTVNLTHRKAELLAD